MFLMKYNQIHDTNMSYSEDLLQYVGKLQLQNLLQLQSYRKYEPNHVDTH